MTEQSIDTPPVDLDLVEADLRDVESVLARLADGTYFTEPGAFVPGTHAPTLPADPADGGQAEVGIDAGLHA